MLLRNQRQYKEYFKAIALAHKEIKAFYFGGIEQIQSLFKSKVEYPVMWLEYYDTNLRDLKSDNFLGMKKGSLVIMSKCAVNNFDEYQAVEEKSEEIIFDIISKIRKDYDENILKTELNNFSWAAIDPYFVDNCHGIRMEFNFHSPLNTSFNQDKWEVEP
jgi:hypothetical protein